MKPVGIFLFANRVHSTPVDPSPALSLKSMIRWFWITQRRLEGLRWPTTHHNFFPKQMQVVWEKNPWLRTHGFFSRLRSTEDELAIKVYSRHMETKQHEQGRVPKEITEHRRDAAGAADVPVTGFGIKHSQTWNAKEARDRISKSARQRWLPKTTTRHKEDRTDGRLASGTAF